MSILNAIEAAELENLIKLNVAKGKAYSTLGKAKEGAEAMQCALDVSDSVAITIYCTLIHLILARCVDTDTSILTLCR